MKNRIVALKIVVQTLMVVCFFAFSILLKGQNNHTIGVGNYSGSLGIATNPAFLATSALNGDVFVLSGYDIFSSRKGVTFNPAHDVNNYFKPINFFDSTGKNLGWNANPKGDVELFKSTYITCSKYFFAGGFLPIDHKQAAPTKLPCW